MAKSCTIDGCERDIRYPSRGWCNTHYQRWRKRGGPLADVAPRYQSPDERFADMTARDGDCIVWTGAPDRQGYARIASGGRYVYVHRFAYEREHGPIPEGMYLDHQCWNTLCCNVGHLRLATPRENSSYRQGANRGRDLPRNVYRHGNKYQASVWHRGEHHHLGTFVNVEDADRAASAKREELFGDYAGRN